MSDMTKTSKVAVMALINHDNGKGVTADQIVMGIPTVNNTGVLNTTLTLTAVAGKGYVGSQTFTYNRLHLTTAILAPSGLTATFPKGSMAKIADVVTLLNALLNINMQADDFIDGDLAPFVGGVANETQVVQIVANANSLAYIGSVLVTLTADDIDLATYLTVTELKGLTYVPPSAA